MKLIANKQLTGSYGRVIAGQAFETNDPDAVILVRMGHARKIEAPKISYETKVVVPQSQPAFETKSVEVSEVDPRLPFRDGTQYNAEPPAVDSESDSMLPIPDVPEQGNANRRGRRRYQGSGS